MCVSEPSEACRGRRIQSRAHWWRRTGGRTRRQASPRKALTGAALAWVRSSRPQPRSTTTPPWTPGTSASKMNSTARNRYVHHQAVTCSPSLHPSPSPSLQLGLMLVSPAPRLVSCWHYTVGTTSAEIKVLPLLSTQSLHCRCSPIKSLEVGQNDIAMDAPPTAENFLFVLITLSVKVSPALPLKKFQCSSD